MGRVDLDKLERALVYVDRIAEGRNPVNNTPYKEDSVLDDPNVIRCMFFIKEVLVEVKNNNGLIGRGNKIAKKDFPVDSLASFTYLEDKTITKFVAQLNEAIDENEYQKLSYKVITDWLKENGYLQEMQDTKIGKRVTLSTEKGNEAGITHSLQTSMSGASYYRVTYNREAQEFLVRMLPEIVRTEQAGEECRTVEETF